MHITQIKHIYDENFELDVKDVSLNKNKIIGLVGENGAGKTTLMSILSGYLKANKICEIEYDCDNYKIAFIPSEMKLYDFMTVKEFLGLMKKYSTTELSVEELIQILQMEGKEDCVIEELSQGMRKKMTLIPMFVKESDLVILDEPFNSVDVKYIYKLKKILQEKKKNRTLLISSHILETLVDLCDEFIVLENGKLIKKISNDNKNISYVEGEIFENGI